MPTVSVKKQNQDGSPSNEIDIIVEARKNQTVYDEIESHGHKLPHGCLNGSCGACRMVVLNGRECLSIPEEKETKTLEIILRNYKNKFGESFLLDKEIRLSCQTKFIDDKGKVEIVPAP
jgi:ferredoxin